MLFGVKNHQDDGLSDITKNETVESVGLSSKYVETTEVETPEDVCKSTGNRCGICLGKDDR